MIIFAALFIYVLKTLGTLCMGLKIAQNLHDRMFKTIIRTTMEFFNHNNSGKILKRFAGDINILDYGIPENLMLCLNVRIFYFFYSNILNHETFSVLLRVYWIDHHYFSNQSPPSPALIPSNSHIIHNATLLHELNQKPQSHCFRS